jgi:hypothetical protein
VRLPLMYASMVGVLLVYRIVEKVRHSSSAGRRPAPQVA